MATTKLFGLVFGGPTWQPLAVGAGGYVRGIDVAPDGTKVIRCDTYGAYIWDSTLTSPGPGSGPGAWRNLVKPGVIPTNGTWATVSYLLNWTSNFGVWAAAIAPSNTNIIYIMWVGYVFISTDKGHTFTATNYTPATASEAPANGTYATCSPHMAVDPNNPDICYVGTTAGLQVTTNAGSTWSAVSAIPAAPTAGNLIIIDPNSSVVDGVTQILYASSDAVSGGGIYQSTNGGSTWSLLNSSGMPTSAGRLVINPHDSSLWMIDNSGSTQNLHRWSGGTWTLQGVTGYYIIVGVIFDPNNSNHILAFDLSGSFYETTNGGTSWTGQNPAQATSDRVATDIPWLANTLENYMTVGDMVTDPSQATWTVYFAEGIAVWVTNPSDPQYNVNPVWTSISAEIEQLVGQSVICPPGGDPICVFADRPLFQITNPHIYPSNHGPNYDNPIVYGYNADYDPNNPSYLAAYTSTFEAGEGAPAGSGGPCYSTNGGATWTTFSPAPPNYVDGSGGQIVVIDQNHQLCLNTQYGTLYYTANAWATATEVTDFTSVSGVSPYWNDFPLCADKVASSSTVYAIPGSGSGIWKSTAYGAPGTWANLAESFSASSAPIRFVSVPGQAGNLFNLIINFFGSGSLYRTTNGGTSWTTVADVGDVYCIGFGPVALGESYPSIGFYGYYNGVQGFWQTNDNFTTVTKIGDQYFNELTYDWPTWCDGDKRILGVWYVTLSGSGVAYFGA